MIRKLIFEIDYDNDLPDNQPLYRLSEMHNVLPEDWVYIIDENGKEKDYKIGLYIDSLYDLSEIKSIKKSNRFSSHVDLIFKNKQKQKEKQ